MSRLHLAIEAGTFAVPPEGMIAVIGAPAGYDVSALPMDRVEVVQAFKPDFDAWVRAGFATKVNLDRDYAAAVIRVPRAKALAKAWIADVVKRTAGQVCLDGQKTDGIEGLLKEIKRRTSVSEAISKAHGKIFVFKGGDFSDWAGQDQIVDGFVTRPGVFSADGIDPASALLANTLPPKLSGRAVDLGAGWGYLSKALLTRPQITQLDLVEADYHALDCARQNLSDPRAEFHWEDATAFSASLYDLVISNPPFHQTRSSDPDLGRAFIRAAAKILKPSGQFWMVANRHLPYEPELNACFAHVTEQPGNSGFKIMLAQKPRRNRR